jgi:DNA ligase-1
VNRFAALLDRLAYEPRRNGKIALVADYLRATPDPERGWALAAMTDGLNFPHAKPALVRGLVEERVDPALFRLSYDHVGDLSETVALIWPRPAAPPETAATPTLTAVVEALRATGKAALPGLIAGWLDRLDETGRWALLKLITGSLRIGVSARLAKTALAALADPPLDPDAIEEVWPDLAPPYAELFAWVEGRGPRPARSRVGFTTPMLSHAIEPPEFAGLDPRDFLAEWKWDGIRVQAVAHGGERRLFSRSGDEITAAFPELAAGFAFDAALDGELLILREGLVQPFGVLQQRLNRKTVTPKLAAEFPAHVRAYDLLRQGEDDLRALPFAERRARLEAFLAARAPPRMDLSPLVPFASWDELAAARADPRGADAAAVEGVMLKRRDSPYVPGRPKGLWFKWKRDPRVVDCVLMYAQRGHGKRSSFYSDYTFGVWTADGALVPVGKAYFGFTDQELAKLDRHVREHTVNRFGPVREVEHAPDKGLVLEIAFEGLQRSTRHRSGLAMRFPRVARIRWDKRPADADRIETLEAMLAGGT